MEGREKRTRGVVLTPIIPFWYASGGISGPFGGAMVRILQLVSRSLSKIPTVRPNEPGVTPKRTKEVQLGIYCTQIQPSEHDIVVIQVIDLIS